ncbi:MULTISPECIES: ribonuclease J [Leptospirillum]|uniref:Ribonuclease J n=1 Tax=Leptospirillum ferriphilum (strain ML-04) TaxID=1048260 RepID=J9ZBL7_LEPFM|nr:MULTISPECIES: ribonuclease J [Leptospirillum]AFS53142.1 putative hydrolase of the metallo-beta-lactamase superfamily [Leptospirillum ferriphilum ML-04]EAY57343.1 MAG: Metallo-beta-lactamase family protein [Leptospirillum rubarum]EIJ77432.1 MAG: Metallo-beta-lactamase family protein [Leptospirillum sp. Group II 'C75']MCL5259244.1 ribonuclease J [Nitrospirota bacterium]
MTSTPPPLTKSEPWVRIIPLGGIGEIGMNMTAYETPDGIVVVDCGVLFPEDDLLGIDLIIPDMTFLKENRNRLLALFLTHGHEDHIGAIPYFLREFDVPVFGTPLTLGLVEGKVRQHKSLPPPRLVSIRPREKYTVGPFTFEPIRITHSIADGVAFAITTEAGTILHTGDFKIDLTPIDNEHFDMHRLCSLGEEGVLCLISDSTNSEKEGLSLSERQVTEPLEQMISQAPGRVIVATFSSNIHRLQQVADVSIRNGRKIALTGRSMETNARVAGELGYLSIPPDQIIRLDQVSQYPPERVTILTTGSQGEPMSALFRMALGDHKHVSIGPGDTILLSARIIPGNERAINKIINLLGKKGAKVFYRRISEIHVSGHASQEDQKLMIRMLRPKYFVPMHGEFRQLSQHARTAVRTGIPEENVFVIENGVVLELTQSRVTQREKVVSGRTFIDGKGIGDVEDMVIRDRQRLGSDGIVTVIVALSQQTGEIVVGPEVSTRGVVLSDLSLEMNAILKTQVELLLQELGPEVKKEVSALKTLVHNHLRRYFKKNFERDPVIIPVLLEM